MARRTKVLLLVAGLGLFQSLFRIAISYEGMSGTIQVLPGAPDSIIQLTGELNLVVGVVGLLVIPGLLLLRAWGFWGSLGMCVASIAFDVWASATFAQSAAMGLVVPGLMLLYLVPVRKSFLAKSIAY